MSFEADDDFSDIPGLFDDNDDGRLSDISSPFDPTKEPNVAPNIGTLMREAHDTVTDQGGFGGQPAYSPMLIEDPFLSDAQNRNRSPDELRTVEHDHGYSIHPEMLDLLSRPILYESREMENFPESNILPEDRSFLDRGFLPTTQRQRLGNQINYNLLPLDVKQLLTYFYNLFWQRTPYGNEFYAKLALEEFMKQSSLEILTAFDQAQMARILTGPINGQRKNRAKACFELVIGRHLWITLNSFQQIHAFDMANKARFYARVWDDFMRVLQQIKFEEFQDYGKMVWVEAWYHNYQGFQQLVREDNDYLIRVFSDNQHVLGQFFEWHNHAFMVLIGGATFKSPFSIDYLLYGDPFPKNVAEKQPPKRRLEPETPLPILEQVVPSIPEQRPEEPEPAPIPAKKPRLSPTPDPSKPHAKLFFLEDTLKSVSISFDCHWSFLVPTAKRFFTNGKSPTIFMTISYTQRSDSSLIFFVETPDGKIVSHVYNTSKNNDQAKKGTIAGYYECEHCEKKSFKLVLDTNENVVYVKIPRASSPNGDISIEHTSCGKIASKDEPKHLNEILYSIATGKIKALCNDAQVLTIDEAEASLLVACQKICANVQGCENFPKWVAEEFNIFYVPWELQVNWRQEWPDDKVFNEEGFLMSKKEMREQSFGRLIKKVADDAYWSQLFYEAITGVIKDEEKKTNLAYEASRFMKYSFAISISDTTDMRVTAMESLYRMDWPRKMKWDTITSIIMKYESGSKVTKKDGRSIKLPPGFAVPSWFSEKWKEESESEMTLRRGLEKMIT